MTGIVAPERAGKVVKRLMAPDMSSGWGIRTLSADHPAYNPFSYQNGSVWPHDNALIAVGMRRYGFDDEATQLMRDVSDAASYFTQHQLPELYAGLAREPSGFPVQYLGANTPQAWAAGSCFSFLAMILGFAPDAPGGKIYLDPRLPDWMPSLTLRDMRSPKGLLDIAFRRDGDVTRFEVLKGDPDAVELKSFATKTERWV